MIFKEGENQIRLLVAITSLIRYNMSKVSLCWNKCMATCVNELLTNYLKPSCFRHQLLLFYWTYLLLYLCFEQWKYKFYYHLVSLVKKSVLNLNAMLFLFGTRWVKLQKNLVFLGLQKCNSSINLVRISKASSILCLLIIM